MTFSYEPLLENEIRLISFTNDSGRECTIERYSLTDGLNYAALSYEWGKESHTIDGVRDVKYQITLNSESVRIQPNLFDALAQIAKYVKGKLWVDFLCIDQTNLDERSQQVRIMKTIYEKAETIYGWLGLPDPANESIGEDVERGIDLMNSMNKFFEDGLIACNWKYDEFLATIDRNTIGFPTSDNQHNIQAWRGLSIMLGQPYWSRTWIYQEATAPGHVLFCFGKYIFEAKLLASTILIADLFEHLSDYNDGRHEIFLYTGSASAVSKVVFTRLSRRSYTSTSFNNLLSLLSGWRHTDCSDARDKVFAPMGLADDVAESLLKIDYTQTIEDLYIDVMRFMFSQYGLCILEYIHTAASDATSIGLREVHEPILPSWVVDWRQRIVLRPFTANVSASRIGQLYNAWPQEDGEKDGLEIRGTVLAIDGFVIDSVTAIAEIWQGGEPFALWSWKEPLEATCQHFSDEIFDRLLVQDAVASMTTDGGFRYARGGAVDWQLLQTPMNELDKNRTQRLINMREQIRVTCENRRPGSTAHQRLAMLPAATAVSDRIAVLPGGRVPYVIRPVPGQSGYYRFIGECYVDGIMDGEAKNLSAQKEKIMFI